VLAVGELVLQLLDLVGQLAVLLHQPNAYNSNHYHSIS